MSREIRFRAWNKQEKCWYNPRFITMNFNGNAWLCRGAEEVEIMPASTIEQYTGLEDKNGKEIYEGDIVEEDIDFNSKMTDGTFRYKVYWNEDELCWSLDPIGPESIHNDLWELNSSCRIIGNIHENPELLGVGE